MKKINKAYIIMALAVAGLTSCSDFLDKTPSKSSNTPVSTAANLLAVYDNIGNRYCANYFASYSTDDADIPREMYLGGPNQFDMNYVVANYTHYRDGIINNSSDGLWTAEYNRIYKANLMISSASEVSGTQEEINEALSCAYFMRAYSFFELATFYCQPWSEANKDELGIPLRMGLSFDETISRGTLEQTYNQIFDDLKASEEHAVYDAVPSIPWRVSKCAINALYARIYLARGEFDKALEYVNKALTNAPALYDFNQFTYKTPVTHYSATDFWPELDINYCETDAWNENKILYNYSEWIYPDFASIRTQMTYPSKQLMDLYDHTNDLRFRYYYIEHGTRRMQSLKYDDYRYNPWYDGRYITSGLTSAEMLLIKAECQVRLGQWQEGLATLTPLREARYEQGTATALTANNKEEALQAVLQERRREMPFYFRFGDIKRFAVTPDTSDDVTVTREFFDVSVTKVNTNSPKTYVIPGNSKCWAMPIFQTEINSSHGAIEQNPE